PAGRRAIASPIRRRVERLRSSVRRGLVASLERVGEDPFPQAPVADDERRKAEGVERRRHDRDARDDQVRPPGLDTGQRCPGGHRQAPDAAEEPLDRRSAQPVALDALRLVLDKTEVERRERPHPPRGAHEVSDARAADPAPLRTSPRWPVARAAAATTTLPFVASRTAVVATRRTRVAARRSARAT